LPDFLKRKEVQIKYKDKLSMILSRGHWKYLDVKTKRTIKEHQTKKSFESGNKVHPLAPRFMQQEEENKSLRRNFGDEEYVGACPEGIRGKVNTVELVYKEKEDNKPEY